ncbi:formate/nitrite transporter family protein [Clostridium sp. SYSU_GA19001]|uniref:formate/nitrite transporter family protein n=1 Tax=Clostridium caldaquaticum TaxID=2940653 RepID=UPI0020774024|nr:formate/nitrite transporter family protein [Clostridium caldaquaticum]MCM8710678.1 formate/nitrite transporter family protein [Clostridium caldaquaticum]
MFSSDVDYVAHYAEKKIKFLKEGKANYITAAALAGLFIGIAYIFIFTVGAYLHAGNSPAYKILMGTSFGVGLSLVMVAGAELFTGTNMVMAIGALEKRTSWMDAFKIWTASWIGNLIGSIITVVLFLASGLVKGNLAEFIIEGAAGKVSPSALQIFARGILCNILVCLAVWCFYKLKDDTAKLIMIFWCLFAFITTGFEHSVANMTLLPLASILSHGAEVSLGAVAHNLVFSTLGNLAGGALFVAFPYWFISKNKKLIAKYEKTSKSA